MEPKLLVEERTRVDEPDGFEEYLEEEAELLELEPGVLDEDVSGDRC